MRISINLEKIKTNQMMRRFFLLAFLFLALFSLKAQETNVKANVKKNVVNIEVAGSGILYSFNYDRMLIIDQNMRFTANIGTWYLPHFESFSDFIYMIGGVAGINTLLGQEKHFAEIGINVSYMRMRDIDDTNYDMVYLPIRLGYRYQKDEGGLFLRASFMPIIPILQDADVEILYPVTPHFAIGIGYVF